MVQSDKASETMSSTQTQSFVAILCDEYVVNNVHLQRCITDHRCKSSVHEQSQENRRYTSSDKTNASCYCNENKWG